ncbi:uncharacterized protein LOC110464240 [Mizuhopecten yessoensis]|uniref:uncharacterized protein LOC110464240 n=1 Tax=Mizuhopecten yessoensis TaxID=6573 RepID=UPI000B4585C7|nr:uncharacterized protein LOC110464240 [Mizuhopecten yessoensis]
MVWIISVCVLMISVCGSRGTVFHVEAENFVTDKFALHRLNATGEESINFNQGQFIHVYFCLRAESEVAVDNILYSNDGGSDMFEVSIDGVKLGEIVTPEHSQNGLLWNNFLSSQQVGPSLTLSSGYHVISINFTSTDFYGVEIDSVFVRVEDRFLEEELFKCSLFCLKDNMYDNGPARDDLSSILLDRKNYDINCPKEDNIILPMYHANVDLYMISALLPRYRSFENHQESHYESCVPPSDELWNFQNFVVPIENKDGHIINNLASLTYHTLNNSRTSVFCVAFDKQASTAVAIDEGQVDTGHVLSVQFKRVASPFYVTIRYRGVQSNWSAEFAKYFTPQVRQDIWTISEHEWSDTEVNEVEMTIVSDPNNPFPIVIEYLRLTKRRLGERQHKLIYSSKDIQAEVVTVDFGPNAQGDFQDKMSVTRLDTGEKWDSASYISILHILPWSQKYGEVLRFYQSGKIRVLPLTPPGLDKLPFGSSFIVGQSDPNERFPRAPISHIDIDPGALQLFITYKDEGKANMIIKPSLHGTRVIVKDVEMAKDSMLFPFVTFSSLWITDGNSEVDHISSNGNDVHHIVNGWVKLYGTAFTFMKKCISKHNTQGPDMRIELLTKRELYQYV